MAQAWQHVFDRLEAAGVNFNDLNAGRMFALDALRRIRQPLPQVVADAQHVAEALQRGIARDEEVAQVRRRCWEYERTNLPPNVAPHEDPVFAALRVALGAMESSVEPEPSYWVGMLARLAEAAGVSSESIGYLLEKHYEEQRTGGVA